MPNNLKAELEYNQIFADGATRLMPHEFAAFKSQARKAGYSVRKSSPVSLDDIMGMDVLGLLEGLGA